MAAQREAGVFLNTLSTPWRHSSRFPRGRDRRLLQVELHLEARLEGAVLRARQFIICPPGLEVPRRLVLAEPRPPPPRRVDDRLEEVVAPVAAAPFVVLLLGLALLGLWRREAPARPDGGSRRRARDSPPRNIRVAASASPRPVPDGATATKGRPRPLAIPRLGQFGPRTIQVSSHGVAADPPRTRLSKFLATASPRRRRGPAADPPRTAPPPPAVPPRPLAIAASRRSSSDNSDYPCPSHGVAATSHGVAATSPR